MRTSHIVLCLFMLGTTAYLEARTTRAADPSEEVTKLGSTQEGEETARFSAEVRIDAVFKAGSEDTTLRFPDLAIGCMPWSDALSIGPEFMQPENVEFPALPTDAQCMEAAHALLADGWSLGVPKEIAKCCFIGGVWVPCHPGWKSRAFPVLRGDGPEAQPYSRTMTIARNGAEESVRIEYVVVVSLVEKKPVDAGAPGR